MVMSKDRDGKILKMRIHRGRVALLAEVQPSLWRSNRPMGKPHLSQRAPQEERGDCSGEPSILDGNRFMKASSKSSRTEPPGGAGKHGENDVACRAMSTIFRLSVPLAVSIFSAIVAVAEPLTVGAVDKVQAHVDATQAGQTRPLVINSDVYFRDRCHSGEGARLQVTLKDGTQLTLGEHATLMVDEFIYDPFRSRAELAITVVKGAFLYVGGLIDKETSANVRIRTPLAAIGIRGTTVWGGPIDKGYGVIVLSGEATVTGRRGTVTLKQGQGTMLFGDRRPQHAAAWPTDRMKRAVASITFGKPPGGQ
jgi:hypothetical protein